MIPTKNRKLKAMKLPKNIEKLYKATECRDCAVVVTRMDFPRILGKFTKVKIQYETSKVAKEKTSAETTIHSKMKQKTNENGMLNKKTLNNYKESKSKQSKESAILKSHSVNRVLKENNRLQKSVTKDKIINFNNKVPLSSKLKQYGIIFTSPITSYKNDTSKTSLMELIPNINESILPSNDWWIDYYPKNDVPKDDKVYDRIAAELEVLMNNGKSETKTTDKSDDFPSIMDILNDNTVATNKSANQSNSTELASSDVESILMGKPNLSKTLEPAMEIDNTDVSNLLADVEQFNAIQPVNSIDTSATEACVDDINNPQSPSILDEALQKGIEEHLPPGITTNNCSEVIPIKHMIESTTINNIDINATKAMEVDTNEENRHNAKDVQINILASKAETISEIVFKKTLNGQCYKSVTCPKSLKYKVELEGRLVEFIGAPKLISNLEDLRILLQIVNETDLKSFYVLQ